MANKKYQNFGRVAEWLKATDCKSVELFLRRFESYLSQQFFLLIVTLRVTIKNEPLFLVLCTTVVVTL